MSSIERFGVSIPRALLKQFDGWVSACGYPNRSEALRVLVREGLLRQLWRGGRGNVSGAITLVYDHHKRETLTKLNEVQHDYQPIIISTQHIHLDHTRCLEIIVVRGAAEKVRALTEHLRGIKGVLHHSLTVTSAHH